MLLKKREIKVLSFSKEILHQDRIVDPDQFPDLEKIQVTKPRGVQISKKKLLKVREILLTDFFMSPQDFGDFLEKFPNLEELTFGFFHPGMISSLEKSPSLKKFHYIYNPEMFVERNFKFRDGLESSGKPQIPEGIFEISKYSTTLNMWSSSLLRFP